MDIKRSAEKSRTELFEALNDDGSFTDWVRARLAPVDRFLSNFHKPLQRRMLFTDPAVEFPASGVVRVKATGDVFLVGESRKDSKNDKAFDNLTVLHLVSSDSSGVAEYFNYRSDLANSLAGNIAKTSEGDFYVSVEYVSTKTAESGDEAYQGKFFVYGPNNLPFHRDGVFTVHDKNYKVVQSFMDSGFSCAIVLQQEDDMVGVIYHAIDSATSGYDVSTGVATVNTIEHTLAASVDHVRQDDAGFKFYNVFLKTNPLPVKVSVGGKLTLPTGEHLKILSVITDNNTQGQVSLACEGG